MKTIQNDIREGNLKNVYLLYGEEQYLIRQARDSLLKAMEAEDGSMNFSKFEGKNIDVDEFVGIAETLPLFIEYRTVLITDSGFFKTANDTICEYFKKPCETTRFLFVEKEVDRRNRFYKLVNSIGRAVEFKAQTAETLTSWMVRRLSAENKKITARASELFLSKTGTDMSNIATEIEKLVCYTYGRNEIYEEDIEAIVTTRTGDHIFDMIAAIGNRRQKEALHLYYDLLAAKEPPLKILALLSRQFNLMLQTKELRQKGNNKSGIASKLGLMPFVADKYMVQSAKFTDRELLSALRDCVDAEEAVKTGQMADRLAAEMIIVKYSAGAVK